jgi:hypothetical protein
MPSFAGVKHMPYIQIYVSQIILIVQELYNLYFVTLVFHLAHPQTRIREIHSVP